MYVRNIKKKFPSKVYNSDVNFKVMGGAMPPPPLLKYALALCCLLLSL